MRKWWAWLPEWLRAESWLEKCSPHVCCVRNWLGLRRNHWETFEVQELSRDHSHRRQLSIQAMRLSFVQQVDQGGWSCIRLVLFASRPNDYSFAGSDGCRWAPSVLDGGLVDELALKLAARQVSNHRTYFAKRNRKVLELRWHLLQVLESML